MHRALLFLPVLLGAVAAYFYYQDSTAATEVKTAHLQRGDIESFVRISGKVVNDRVVTLAALVNGEIRSVQVTLGDSVKKSQLLLSFDDTESRHLIKRAQAEKTLRAQALELARHQLKRLQKLKHSGAITREQLEQAENEVKLARSRLAIATESLAIEQFRSRNTRLYAPYSGVITEKKVDAGQWTESGTPLLVLASDQGQEIEAQVDAGDFSAVQVGMQVTVSADAYPDQHWQETIRRIAPAVSSENSKTTNTFPVRITLGHSAPLLLLNQQVDIKLRTAARKNTLLMPLSALLETDDGKQNVLTIKQGRIKKVAITTGIENYTHVEIIEGLAPDAEVVLPEGRTFNDNERVITNHDQAAAH